MSSSMLVKVTCLAMICFVLCIPLTNSAPSCPQVQAELTPCLRYVTLPGSSPTYPPPEPCCNGVRTLNGDAQTPTDRQQICGCLKSIMVIIPGLNVATVAALPKNCGVDLGYEISPNMDCDNVNFY